MRRSLRWCAWAAAGIAGLVLVAVLALLMLGADALRPTIASSLSDALGRDVTIEGHLTLGWNEGPALVAEGVSITGSDGAPPAAEAQRIMVRLDPSALWRGEIILSRIALRQVIVRTASFARNGTPPEQPVGDQTPPADLSFLADRFTVSIADVTIAAGEGDLPLTIGMLTLEANRGSATELTADLSYRGAAFDLALAGPGLETLLAGRSWPVEITLTQDANTAHASGVLKSLTNDPAADLTLHAEGPDLDSLLGALGLSSGIEDPFTLAAHVEADFKRIAVSELQISVGTFEALGDLTADLAASPTAIAGRLDLSTLPGGGDGGSIDAAELLARTVPYETLETIDLDLDLTIARHELAGLVLSAMQVPLRLSGGELVIDPLVAAVDGEQIAGSLRVSAGTNTITAALHADRVPLANLLRRWRPDLALFGEAGGGAELDAQASGLTLRDLLASLQLRLDARNLQLSARWKDGSATRAEFSTFSIDAGTDRYLTAQADGTIDGSPATLFLTTGQLRELVAGTDGWPLELHLGNDALGVDLVGVIMHPDTSSGLRLEGLLRADGFAPINSLFDIDVPVDGRIESYFHLSDIDSGVRLDWIDATVGESSLKGNLDIVDNPDDVSVSGSLSGPMLVVDLGGDSEAETDIDALIMEQGDLDGVVLDIALDIDRLVVPPVHFDALDGRLLLEQGVLSLADAQTTMLGFRTDVALAIDASQARPRLTGNLTADDVDPHDMGNNLGLQGLLSGHIDRIALELDSHGTTLREYAEAATAELGMDGGNLQIGSGATGLEFRRVELLAAPDTPISGIEELQLGAVPITLALSFVPLVDLIASPPPWNLDGHGSLLGLDFEVERTIAPSLQIYAYPVILRVRSDDIRTALAELGVSMPRPLPLTTQGTVQVFADRVAFDLDSAQLAGSDLAGSLELSFDAEPQRVTARFDSQVIDINDFRAPEDTADEPPDAQERSMAELLATELPAWSVPDLALDLRLDAREIYWSEQTLEDVGTRITTVGDTLHIDDLQAQVFGGSVSGAITLQPQGAETRIAAELSIEHIDSDKLLRDVGIAEAASGEATVQFAIDTKGSTPGGMLGALDGNVALKRGQGWMRSGAVAVLTKDLLSALLSSLFNPSEETTIRCIVLNVDFEKGKGTLRQSAIALDNVVIVARGGLDLGAGTIDMELDPKAIDWSFLRLLTPVYITGKLLDPVIKPHSGEVLAGLGAALFGAGPIYDGDLDALCAGT